MTDEEHANIPEPFRSSKFIFWIIKHKRVVINRGSKDDSWASAAHWMSLRGAWHMLPDLMQECLMQGIKSVKTFNPNVGSAKNWAIWSFMSAINKFIRIQETEYYRLGLCDADPANVATDGGIPSLEKALYAAWLNRGFLPQLKNDKQELVVRCRFGIGLHETMTLQQIGNMYGVTREYIRQIEAKTLQKLRHPKFYCQLAR